MVNEDEVRVQLDISVTGSLDRRVRATRRVCGACDSCEQRAGRQGDLRGCGGTKVYLGPVHMK